MRNSPARGHGLFLGCAAALLAGVCAAEDHPEGAAAATWRLAPIVGDNNAKWAAGPNWTWDQGNPLDEKGAWWRLAVQPQANPDRAAGMVNMVKGQYVAFNHIWRAPDQEERDPANQYRRYFLAARNGASTPGAGPASLLLFKPPAAGKYRVRLSAGVFAQNKTAGHARAELYRWAWSPAEKRARAESVKDFALSAPGGFGADQMPDRLEYDAELSLAEGEWLVLRLQGINPGPAPVGTVGLDFDPEKEGAFEISSTAGNGD